jgi:hypothetical protein
MKQGSYMYASVCGHDADTGFGHVCEFPMVTVTNYYKLSALKQYKFMILRFWKSKV